MELDRERLGIAASIALSTNIGKVFAEGRHGLRDRPLTSAPFIRRDSGQRFLHEPLVEFSTNPSGGNTSFGLAEGFIAVALERSTGRCDEFGAAAFDEIAGLRND